MTKEELEIDNKRLDFNEKVQLVVKKEELKEQDIRLNKLCFDCQEKEKRIAELEAQIEKMKNCKNCANYMISGKCPSFFRTGWCKNWEMTRSKK
ncbi:MAG: hypothetical protein K6G09_06710 [Treponema sp.]|nr:hypothetical protein [Treponema sp.]